MCWSTQPCDSGLFYYLHEVMPALTRLRNMIHIYVVTSGKKLESFFTSSSIKKILGCSSTNLCWNWLAKGYQNIIRFIMILNVWKLLYNRFCPRIKQYFIKLKGILCLFAQQKQLRHKKTYFKLPFTVLTNACKPYVAITSSSVTIAW